MRDAAIMVVVACLLVVYQSMIVPKWSYKKQKLDGKLYRVEFSSPDTLIVSQSGIVATFPWSSLVDYVPCKEAHLLVLENELQGILLPRKAFASELEFTSFGSWASGRFAVQRDNDAQIRG